MRSKVTSVSEYLAEQPSERRAALTKMRALIRKIAPDAKESMQFGMASYELKGLFCSLASQKNYMALYVCETDVVAAHRKALGKLDCGKSCIRFRTLQELPLDVIEKILDKARALRIEMAAK